MLTQHTPFWAWFLPLAFGSPWVVGIVVLWRHRIRDGSVPRSGADLARGRMWIS